MQSLENNSKAVILLDSVNEATGDRLTTFKISFPKCLLAELNTHRMLSRSVSSSRAIKSSVMRKRILNESFRPINWSANNPGMQSNSDLTGIKKTIASIAWNGNKFTSLFWHWLAGDIAGLHKQHANRLIETYLYVDAIVSSTTWDNFFNLRAHRDAQPEFQEVAHIMKELYRSNEPKVLRIGEWHMPLLRDVDKEMYSLEQLKNISSARCARTSYFLTDGSISNPEADLKLCERLAGSDPKHLSPFEHVAIALPDSTQSGNFTGWGQYRKELETNTIRN